MSDAASAARFGANLKALGSAFYWVGLLAAVITLLANLQQVSNPFVKYGLPSLIAVVGLVAGSLIRAAGYALTLMAARASADRVDNALLDA
jgi:hypothetical protein